jgi:hypothetical protein
MHHNQNKKTLAIILRYGDLKNSTITASMGRRSLPVYKLLSFPHDDRPGDDIEGALAFLGEEDVKDIQPPDLEEK